MKFDLIHRAKQTVPMRPRTLDEIPQEMHAAVRRRAARLNMRIDEYLAYLALPAHEKMPVSEWIKTLSSPGPRSGKKLDVVAMLHEAREERDLHLYNILWGNKEEHESD